MTKNSPKTTGSSKKRQLPLQTKVRAIFLHKMKYSGRNISQRLGICRSNLKSIFSREREVLAEAAEKDLMHYFGEQMIEKECEDSLNRKIAKFASWMQQKHGMVPVENLLAFAQIYASEINYTSFKVTDTWLNDLQSRLTFGIVYGGPDGFLGTTTMGQLMDSFQKECETDQVSTKYGVQETTKVILALNEMAQLFTSYKALLYPVQQLADSATSLLESMKSDEEKIEDMEDAFLFQEDAFLS